MAEACLVPREPQSMVETKIACLSLLNSDLHCLLQGSVMILWSLDPPPLPPWGPNGVGEVAGTLHWVAMTFPVRMLGGSAVPLGESVGYV